MAAGVGAGAGMAAWVGAGLRAMGVDIVAVRHRRAKLCFLMAAESAVKITTWCGQRRSQIRFEVREEPLSSARNPAAGSRKNFLNRNSRLDKTRGFRV